MDAIEIKYSSAPQLTKGNKIAFEEIKEGRRVIEKAKGRRQKAKGKRQK